MVTEKETPKQLNASFVNGQTAEPTPFVNGQTAEHIPTELVLVPGGIEIDLQRSTVTRDGTLVNELAFREWRVLRYLVLKAGTAVPKQEIAEGADVLSKESIKPLIKRIRTKLGLDPKHGPLKTIKGFGFMVENNKENPDDVIKAAGGIEVNIAKRQVKKDGEFVYFTPTEYRFIELLAVMEGNVIFYEDLFPYVCYDKYVMRVYIARIRRKLHISKNGVIRVVRGVGVFMQTPEMEEAERAEP